MIVFDASTLILVAKIELLRRVSHEIEIIIPDMIKGECTRKETYDAKLIKRLVEGGKITVGSAKSEDDVKRLKEDFSMEEEAHAVALASEKGCPLATDDGQAIKACRILGIEFTTAVDFLIRSVERGDLSVGVALEKLDSLEAYGRYSPQIIEFAREKIGGERE